MVDQDNLAWTNGTPMRILEVEGEDAFGISEDFVGVDYASEVIPGWTCTLAGSSTVRAGVTSGGHMVLTSGATTTNGVNCQVDGTAFETTGDQVLTYFGVKFQVSEGEQADWLVGLCATDTSAIAAVADGIYFENGDGDENVDFVTENTSTPHASGTIATLGDATDIVLEIYWDGTTAFALVNGVQVDTSTTTIPAVALTPTVAFRTGDSSAETMTVDWVRAFQVGR